MKSHLRLFDTLIYTGDDALIKLEHHIQKKFSTSTKIILVDENTLVKCFPLILKQCRSLKSALVIEMKSGEQNKTFETALNIWQQLAENFIDRNALLINLGGGVVSDIGTFCASTYLRGICFINVPTTLTAMVDAAIGGKTGIDFKNLKNFIGTFAHPDSVFICPRFLKTLDERNLKCGFAEMVKHALVADEKLWEKFSRATFEECINDKNILHSVKIKTRIVKKDPNEKSLRKILNFGHTAGHAIESYSIMHDAEPLLHGECVATGMIIESFLSYQTALLKKEDAKKITEFIDEKFLLKKLSSKAIDQIIKLMHHDKKNNKKKMNFTLLDAIGVASIDHYCEDKLVREAFGFYNSVAE
ncbi:MAG: 3-dehydroquinate synthase [Bacteroidia bacterium]